MKLLDLALSTTWMMHQPALEVIFRVLQRQEVPATVFAEAFHHSPSAREAAVLADKLELPLKAVAARDAVGVEGSYNLQRRGTVGIVSVTGPIVRYGNMFHAISGSGQTVETIARDFNLALNDPNISSILLNVDSPGGESNGIAELADMIYAARGTKPIEAYVSDLGASAAYWIASAADKITVAQTAAVGSIGCAAVFHKSEDGSIEIVSSVSPNKRPNIETKQGRATWQGLIDSLGEVFVQAVARNRSTTVETVIQDFGAGFVLVGQSAVDAGMADAVGSFEGVLASLSAPADDAPVTIKPARRAANMGLRDKFFSMLDSLDPALIDNQPDTAASAPVVNTSISPVNTTIPGSANTTTVVPTAEPVSTPAPEAREARPVENTTPHVTSDVNDELIRLRAENRRLLLARIQDAGRVFASQRVAEQKAFPGEEEHIVAAYVQAALDDEKLGVEDGQPTRVTLLGNMFASRVSVSHLTAEGLGSAVAQVISHRASAPNRETDAVPADRKAQLLGHSPLGRTVLNGTSKN